MHETFHSSGLPKHKKLYACNTKPIVLYTETSLTDQCSHHIQTILPREPSSAITFAPKIGSGIIGMIIFG